MTQYPNEKDPHSNWVSPQQGSYPPPTQDPYTSRDGAPEAHTSSSQHQPPQGHYPPPQGPPPDYGYAQSHPQEGSAYVPKEPSQEIYLSPPPNTSPYQAPAPAPQAGSFASGSQDGQQGGGSLMSLAAFFGNKGPPQMWQRQPPPQLPYSPFPPMCLISNSKDLSNGFPELPPPCQLNPHPFATHDITEEDWKRCVGLGGGVWWWVAEMTDDWRHDRFLVDVKKAGSLSPAQRIRSNVIPLVTGLSFFSAYPIVASLRVQGPTPPSHPQRVSS